MLKTDTFILLYCISLVQLKPNTVYACVQQTDLYKKNVLNEKATF